MRKMNKICMSSIARLKKVRIYNAYVQSIMLFGCSTWSMNKEMERSLDSFNRRMMKHACGIFWPERMSTEVNDLIEPATCEVKKRRWQMLCHFLRMDDHVPAKEATIDSIKTIK